MKILVNGFTYKINIVNEDVENERFDFGTTENHKQVISINVNEFVSNERVIQTIKHEITHAFHFEYFGCNVFDDVIEMLAEFVSIYAEDILILSKEVWEYVKKETNR